MKTLKYLFFLLMFVSLQAYAVKFVKSPPLKSVVKTSVKDCGTFTTTQVPLITWGGDIATTYANGNKATTTPQSFFVTK